MKTILQSTDVDVWAAVEDGYEGPKAVEKDGVVVIRLISRWTNREKETLRHNAKAVSSIFTSVKKKQFNLIQGCTNAREAWDILQTHFEGTDKVKCSRMNFLTTRFENLKMEEHESISYFSSQLCALDQEARTLGKNYKDKKLVKNFLRCLPKRYTAYKAGMSVSLNTDEISFHEVVGMVKAHEMELDGVKNHTEVEVAIAETTSQKPESEDKVIQIICVLQQVLHDVIHGQENISVSSQGHKAGEPCVNIEGQCHECRGY